MRKINELIKCRIICNAVLIFSQFNNVVSKIFLIFGYSPKKKHQKDHYRTLVVGISQQD